MELCRSSLQSQARKARRPISEGKIRKIMRDICLGLKDLHSKKIVHLDIKPGSFIFNPLENVLVSNSKKYKIADLGLARLVTKLDGDVPEGDSRYLAPELLNEDPVAVVPDLGKADVFSLGIMMYELMRNAPLPLNGEEWLDIRNGRIDTPSLAGYSHDLRTAILSMLHPNPAQRPSAAEVLGKYLPSPEEAEIRHLRQENARLKLDIYAMQQQGISRKQRRLSLH